MAGLELVRTIECLTQHSYVAASSADAICANVRALEIEIKSRARAKIGRTFAHVAAHTNVTARVFASLHSRVWGVFACAVDRAKNGRRMVWQI